MSEEKDNSRLDALTAKAAEFDAKVGPTEEQAEEMQAEAKAEAEAQAWAMIPAAIGSVLSMFAPELQAVYTEDACQRWGERMVPVAEKYGWNGPTNLPEVGLLIATASMAMPTVLVLRVKLAAMREAAEAERRKQANAQAKDSATDVVARDVGLTDGAAGGGAKDGG